MSHTSFDLSSLGARVWGLIFAPTSVIILTIGMTVANTEKTHAASVCVLSPALPTGTAFANPGALACGPNTVAGATDATAVGDGAQATNLNATAVGQNARAAGTAAGGQTALGADSQARNAFTTAVGASAIADSGDNSTALGAGSIARGTGNTTLGANARVGEFGGVTQSTAIGANAVATLSNQVVLGTTNETYTAPGITSATSRSRQSGPLEIVTSDAAGNMATDGGALFQELDRLNAVDNQLRNDINTVESGVAIALSAVGPDLVGAERFGLSLNWGGFEGASAIGGGATAVVSRWNSSRLAVTGGVGVALEGESAVGGRVGGQWTW